MFRKRWELWMRGTAVAALLGMGASAGAQSPSIVERPAPNIVRITPSEDMPADVVAELIKKAQQSKYWIGVECGAVDDALKTQLELEHGVVAMAVIDDSPASKAGVQQFDILLQLGDKKLSDVSHLIDAVDATGGKETRLIVVRRGKEESLVITPIERPRRNVENVADEIVKQYRSVQGGDITAEQDVRVMVIRPGAVVTQGTEVKLPEGMSISITKSNNEPAKIDVQHGDKKWSVTENELDKLPPEVREHVERMRAPLLVTPGGPEEPIKVYSGAFRILPAPDAPGKPPAPPVKVRAFPGTPVQPPHVAELNKKMDEVLKALKEQRQGSVEQLHKDVERLRQEVETLQKQLKERN